MVRRRATRVGPPTYCLNAHMWYRAFWIAARLTAVAAVIFLPTPSSGQTPVPAGAIAAPTEDDILRFKMPTVTVTAQKEPEDRQKVPVSVTAVTRETIEAAGIRLVSEAAILSPNTIFTEWTRAQVEQRAVPWHRLEPEQSRRHDLSRWRAAAERELVEHRAARRRADRVRARAAERAVRPQHARRPGQRHQQPSVDGGWTGSLAVPFANHGAWSVRGGVSGPVVKDKARRRRLRRAGQPRRLHRQRRHRPRHRSRSAFSVKGQVLWVPDAQLGSARHRDRRARPRRRLRPPRRGGAARQPVPRRARFRGLDRSRHRRHDHPGAPRPAVRSSSRARPAS